MGGVCSTYGGWERCIQDFGGETWIRQLYQGVDRIIWKQTMKKVGRIAWINLADVGGCCEHGYELSGFIRISWECEKLLASQEVTSSVSHSVSCTSQNVVRQQRKEDHVAGSCSTHGEETYICIHIHTWREDMASSYKRGIIMLKWILEKYDVNSWTGLIWRHLQSLVNTVITSGFIEGDSFLTR